MTMVWIYVDSRHRVGHPDHLKVFADPATADEWFKIHDPEGVAFGYDIIGSAGTGGAPQTQVDQPKRK